VSELQRIVDSLAQSTKRAVSAHDPNRRLLAHSSQSGKIDEVRKESILTRKGPAKGFAWAKTFGIETSEDPVRIPPNNEIGMGPRICAPIRFDGQLLGYLWLIDPDESLPDETIPLIRSAANAAGLAIQQEELMKQIDRGRERELLRDLLSEQSDVRLHAVDDLIESSLLVPLDQVGALVVRPVRDRTAMTTRDTGLRARVERVMTRVRQRVAMRHSLQLLRPDHGVVLITFSSHEGGCLEELGTELQTRMVEALPEDDHWRAVVGVGDPQATLAESHFSYTQARKAAEVAGLLSAVSPVAKWSDLGVYQTLLQLPLSEVDMTSLHPGLKKLFEARDSHVWLQTLETYLDLGCDARESAKILFINRGTLYHRIHRIEEIAGVHLSSGRDRLALHLGLKLARLAGLLDTPSIA
jgi:sugar diacid utilization regulator